MAVYYFYQYALRSAPSVMMPQLTEAFGVNALGVSAIVGMFYYGYSPFSLVAGAAIDRFGARRIIPIGAAMVGVGALLFGTGNVAAANVGRFLQGAGGVFALVGAVYLITKNFPVSMAASFIGATQMFGMAGGSAGQFLVGPTHQGRTSLGPILDLRRRGWAGDQRLPADVPAERGARAVSRRTGRRDSIAEDGVCEPAVHPLRFDFRPAVYSHDDLRHDLGRAFPSRGARSRIRRRRDAGGHGAAGLDDRLPAARLPLGQAGPPQTGHPRRLRGVLGVLAWILFGDPAILRGPVVGILMGVASGAAMLPYTVIKEANPPELGGSATGVINFINFTFSALLGPVFGSRLVQDTGGNDTMALAHYQAGFAPLLFGIVLAIGLDVLLEGNRARGPKPSRQPVSEEIGHFQRETCHGHSVVDRVRPDRRRHRQVSDARQSSGRDHPDHCPGHRRGPRRRVHRRTTRVWGHLWI